MTVSYQYRNNRPIAPKLIVANHFLAQNGFGVGTKILVTYEKNIIIIKKLT